MSRTTKTSLSVKELIDILQHPKSKTLTKKAEILIDRDEVKKQMKLKWKDPGYCNIQFMKDSSVRAKILNEWELERIYMATRSYVTPKESKPYQYDRESRQFPKVTMKAYPHKFQRYLKQIELEKEDLLFKEKRTVTEGMGYNTTKSSNTNKLRIFKPTNTASSLFGFAGGLKSLSTKHTNIHMKTANV